MIAKNNPEEMAKQAVLLLNDKKRYRRFQKNGINWAKSLSWEETTRQSMNLIKRLAKNG